MPGRPSLPRNRQQYVQERASENKKRLNQEESPKLWADETIQVQDTEKMRCISFKRQRNKSSPIQPSGDS